MSHRDDEGHAEHEQQQRHHGHEGLVGDHRLVAEQPLVEQPEQRRGEGTVHSQPDEDDTDGRDVIEQQEQQQPREQHQRRHAREPPVPRLPGAGPAGLTICCCWLWSGCCC